MKKNMISSAAFFCFLLLATRCLATPAVALEQQLKSSSLTIETAKLIEHEANNMLNQSNISKADRQIFTKIYLTAQQKIAALTATLDQLALAKAEAKGKTAQIAAAAADAAAYLQKAADDHGVTTCSPAINITYSTPSDPEVYNDAIRQALIAQATSPFPNKEGVIAFINEATHKLYVDINMLYSKTIPPATSSSTVHLPALKKTTDKLQRATKKTTHLVKKNKKRKDQRLTALAAKKTADNARAAAEAEQMQSKATADKADADAAAARKAAKKAAKIKEQIITAAKNRVAKEKAEQHKLDAIVKKTLREQQEAEHLFKEKEAKLNATISDEKNKLQQAQDTAKAALAAQREAERSAQQAADREAAAIAAATQAGQTADQEKINRAAADAAKQEANQARALAEEKALQAEAAQQRAVAAKQIAENALAELKQQQSALEGAHQQAQAALITKENEVAKQKKKAKTRKQQLAQETQRNSTLATSLKTLQPQLITAQRAVQKLTTERDTALAQVATAQEAARLAVAALTASQAALQEAQLALREKTSELQITRAELAEARKKVVTAEEIAATAGARAAAIEQKLRQAESEKDEALAKALDQLSSVTTELQSKTISPARSDTPTSPRSSSSFSSEGDDSPRSATSEVPGEPRVFGMTQKDILIALQQFIIKGNRFTGTMSKNNIVDIGTNRKVMRSNTSNLQANMLLIRDIVFRLAETTALYRGKNTPTIQHGLDLTEEQLREQYSGSKQLRGGGMAAEKKNAVTLEELAGMLFMNLKEAKENTARPTREPILNKFGIELSRLHK